MRRFWEGSTASQNPELRSTRRHTYGQSSDKKPNKSRRAGAPRDRGQKLIRWATAHYLNLSRAIQLGWILLLTGVFVRPFFASGLLLIATSIIIAFVQIVKKPRRHGWIFLIGSILGAWMSVSIGFVRPNTLSKVYGTITEPINKAQITSATRVFQDPYSYVGKTFIINGTIKPSGGGYLGFYDGKQADYLSYKVETGEERTIVMFVPRSEDHGLNDEIMEAGDNGKRGVFVLTIRGFNGSVYKNPFYGFSLCEFIAAGPDLRSLNSASQRLASRERPLRSAATSDSSNFTTTAPSLDSSSYKKSELARLWTQSYKDQLFSQGKAYTAQSRPIISDAKLLELLDETLKESERVILTMSDEQLRTRGGAIVRGEANK